MPENAFVNCPVPPTEAGVAVALGSAKFVWDEFRATLVREKIADSQVWKTHSPKWGWSLRMLKKKRTIVWLSPGRGEFAALFILGARAVAAARAAKLPRAVVAALDGAPKYPEGTGLRLVVKSPRSLRALRQLATIKAAN
ncbi:MAG: DUF3788 family protein [Opitutae bacterium]|nr:DUF3788 family protein [Opitutae bacterium]